MGIEDSAVLSELLGAAQERVLAGELAAERSKAIVAAFEAFDTSRRERTQWLVQSSRFCSMVCQGRGLAKDWDVEKKRQELGARAQIIWDWEVKDAVRDALANLEKKLSGNEPFEAASKALGP